MPNLTADRVKETTTTTGTGTITLAGAVAQFRSFASAFADGSVVQYAIVGQTGTEWEVGNGTFTASGTTLARTTVLASSNSGSAVNFSAGTKDVFATVTAAELATHVVGPSSATDDALARFDATTGKLVQNSVVTADDVGVVSGVTQLNVDNLRLDGNTISSTNTNGDINLTPNGSGLTRGTGDFIASQDVFAGRALYIGGTTWATSEQAFDQSSQYLGSSVRVVWGSAGTPDAYGFSPDLGIGRHADGVLKVTAGAVTAVRALQGGGAAVASASALPVPTGRVFHVTGTTNITSITSTNLQAGVVITMIFDGVLTVTDGGNLKLAGNFVTAADSTLSLVYDGTNWYETGRSTN